MKGIWKTVDTVIAWIEDLVSGTCLAAVVCIAVASVIGRYVFQTGFLWADEVNQALLVAVGMFGSARAVRYNGHAEFTSFIAKQKSRGVRVAMRGAIMALTLVLLVFMLVISYQFTIAGTMKTSVLRVPRMYFYMSIPIGFALCVYEYLKVAKARVLTDAQPEDE